MTPIKINDDWTITKDAYNWILTYQKEGEVNPKTNKPVLTTKTTYHATLEQVLNHFVDEEIVGDSLSEIIDQFKLVRKTIAAFCAENPVKTVV